MFVDSLVYMGELVGLSRFIMFDPFHWDVDDVYYHMAGRCSFDNETYFSLSSRVVASCSSCMKIPYYLLFPSVSLRSFRIEQIYTSSFAKMSCSCFPHVAVDDSPEWFSVPSAQSITRSFHPQIY